MFAFASFARDSTRAAFASGNSCCETLSFLAKHSWVFRVACWVVVARCLAGFLWVGWLLLLLAVLAWLGWLSSLFSLSRLGVSPATFGPIVTCFLNLPKGGTYRQFFIGVFDIAFFNCVRDPHLYPHFHAGRRLATFCSCFCTDPTRGFPTLFLPSLFGIARLSDFTLRLFRFPATFVARMLSS